MVAICPRPTSPQPSGIHTLRECHAEFCKILTKLGMALKEEEGAYSCSSYFSKALLSQEPSPCLSTPFAFDCWSLSHPDWQSPLASSLWVRYAPLPIPA